MKKFLLFLLFPLALLGQEGNNQADIGGLLIASNFAQWTVPQGNQGGYSWSSPDFCKVTFAGSNFNAFSVGTQVAIVDTGNPANSETVTVEQFTSNTSGCSITVNNVNQHNTFFFRSATGGLGEALAFAGEQPYQIILTPDWTKLGGITSMITSAKGNVNVPILDQRSSVIVPYIWNSTLYVANPFAGGAINPGGSLGSIQYYAAGPTFGGFNGNGILKLNGPSPPSIAAPGTDYALPNANTTGTAGNLSGTPALPNGTTATTQSPGDTSTKLATDAFVAAQFAPGIASYSTAGISPAGIANVYNSQITTDACAAINAAGLTLPAAGGIIDATWLFPGTYTCTNRITALNRLTQAVSLRLQPGTNFVFNMTLGTSASPNNCAVPVGPGGAGTFQPNGASSIVVPGNSYLGGKNFAAGSSFTGFGLVCSGSFNGDQESMLLDGVGVTGNASQTMAGALMYLGGINGPSRISNSGSSQCFGTCVEVAAGNGVYSYGSGSIDFDNDAFTDAYFGSATYPGAVLVIDALSSQGGIGNIAFARGLINDNGPHNPLIVINGRGSTQVGAISFYNNYWEVEAATTSSYWTNADPIQITDASQVYADTLKIGGARGTGQTHVIDIATTNGVQSTYGIQLGPIAVGANGWTSVIHNIAEGTDETGTSSGGEITVPQYFYGGRMPFTRISNYDPPSGSCTTFTLGSTQANSARSGANLWSCESVSSTPTWVLGTGGGGGPPSGSAGGVLSGTYPNPGLNAPVAAGDLAAPFNTFNAISYGAACVAGTDDTTAVQNTLNAAAYNNSSTGQISRVQLCPTGQLGTGSGQTTLNIGSGTYIQGPANIIVPAQSANPLFLMTSTDNDTIEGLTITFSSNLSACASGMNNAACTPIRYDSANPGTSTVHRNVRILNNNIFNSGWGPLIGPQSGNDSLSGILVQGNTIGQTGTYPPTSYQFNDGIHVGGSVSGFTIANNFIYGRGDAGVAVSSELLSGSTLLCHEGTITGNTIFEGREGIDISGCNNVVITANRVYADISVGTSNPAFRSIYYGGNLPVGIQVSDNWFHNYQSAAGVPDNSAKFDCTGGCGAGGYTTVNPMYSVFQDNHVDTLYLKGSSLTASGNTFANNGQLEIDVDTTNSNGSYNDIIGANNWLGTGTVSLNSNPNYYTGGIFYPQNGNGNLSFPNKASIGDPQTMSAYEIMIPQGGSLGFSSTNPSSPSTGDTWVNRIGADHLVLSSGQGSSTANGELDLGSLQSGSIIDTGLGTSTSPVCPNGAGGALTISGCSGGGGTPGGSDTQVQFNSSSAFAGDSTFTFNNSSKQLSIANVAVNSLIPATSGNNQNSGPNYICGSYWNGTASTPDCYYLTNFVEGTTTNPYSGLQLVHSGATGGNGFTVDVPFNMENGGTLASGQTFTGLLMTNPPSGSQTVTSILGNSVNFNSDNHILHAEGFPAGCVTTSGGTTTTQGDCAFYSAKDLAVSTGNTVDLYFGNNNSTGGIAQCQQWVEPTAGYYMVNLIGSSMGGSSVIGTCSHPTEAMLVSSGNGASFTMRNLTFNTNSNFGACYELENLIYNGIISDANCNGTLTTAVSGLDHLIQIGNPSNYVQDIILSNISVSPPFGQVGGYAQLTPIGTTSLTGITINNGGSGYAAGYAVGIVNDPNAYCAGNEPTFTVTLNGSGVVTGTTITNAGTCSGGLPSLVVFQELNVTYGAKLYLSDSTIINPQFNVGQYGAQLFTGASTFVHAHPTLVRNGLLVMDQTGLLDTECDTIASTCITFATPGGGGDPDGSNVTGTLAVIGDTQAPGASVYYFQSGLSQINFGYQRQLCSFRTPASPYNIFTGASGPIVPGGSGWPANAKMVGNDQTCANVPSGQQIDYLPALTIGTINWANGYGGFNGYTGFNNGLFTASGQDANFGGNMALNPINTATGSNNYDSGQYLWQYSWWNGSSAQQSNISAQAQVGGGTNPSVTLRFDIPGGTTGAKAFSFYGWPVTVGSLNFAGTATSRTGTFNCTAGGIITIANANETNNSAVNISLNNQGGTIAAAPFMLTVSSGTGFTVQCSALDTSTYNYTIMN